MPVQRDPLPPGWAGQSYAGFGRRLLAQLIDTALLMLVGLLVGVVVYGLNILQGIPPEEATTLSTAADWMLNLIVALITLLFWVTWQATPGKRLLGLRIVDAETGGLPPFNRLVLRYVGYFISALPLSLGFLWMLWDRRQQCWHDKLGRTVVLHASRPSTGGFA